MFIHLQQGFDLIRNEKFEEAISHFQDRQKLKAMDVARQWGPFTFSQKFPGNAAEAKKLVKSAAKQNMAFNKNGDLSIKFANIGLMDMETGAEFVPKTASEKAIVQHLQHEQALMAAEENIHSYQNLNGDKNVTYIPKKGQDQR